jgi:hypothetical protein
MVIIPASIHLKVALTDWHFAQTNNRARRTQMAANRYTIPKLMELQPVILELQTAMNAVDGATIWRNNRAENSYQPTRRRVVP